MLQVTAVILGSRPSTTFVMLPGTFANIIEYHLGINCCNIKWFQIRELLLAILRMVSQWFLFLTISSRLLKWCRIRQWDSFRPNSTFLFWRKRARNRKMLKAFNYWLRQPIWIDSFLKRLNSQFRTLTVSKIYIINFDRA